VPNSGQARGRLLAAAPRRRARRGPRRLNSAEPPDQRHLRLRRRCWARRRLDSAEPPSQVHETPDAGHAGAAQAEQRGAARPAARECGGGAGRGRARARLPTHARPGRAGRAGGAGRAGVPAGAAAASRAGAPPAACWPAGTRAANLVLQDCGHRRPRATRLAPSSHYRPGALCRTGRGRAACSLSGAYWLTCDQLKCFLSTELWLAQLHGACASVRASGGAQGLPGDFSLAGGEA